MSDLIRIVPAEPRGRQGFVIEFCFREESQTWGLIEELEPDLAGPFVHRREAEEAIDLYMHTSDQVLLTAIIDSIDDATYSGLCPDEEGELQ